MLAHGDDTYDVDYDDEGYYEEKVQRLASNTPSRVLNTQTVNSTDIFSVFC